jgi:hypothetical protein
MQNETTLLDLGFTHHPDYDFNHTGCKGYRLELNGKVWRARIEDTLKPIGISLGMVVKKNGVVDRWRDCFSDGSVKKHIYAF